MNWKSWSRWKDVGRYLQTHCQSTWLGDKFGLDCVTMDQVDWSWRLVIIRVLVFSPWDVVRLVAGFANLMLVPTYKCTKTETGLLLAFGHEWTTSIDKAISLLWQHKSMKTDGWKFFSAFCRCIAPTIGFLFALAWSSMVLLATANQAIPNFPPKEMPTPISRVSKFTLEKILGLGLETLPKLCTRISCIYIYICIQSNMHIIQYYINE